MLKETRAVEYILEIIRVLHNSQSEIECKEIVSIIEADNHIREVSQTYVPKILSKLVKCGLVESSERGYTLRKVLNDISVCDALQVLDMPMSFDNLYNMCIQIKEKSKEIPIVSVYNFEK